MDVIEVLYWYIYKTICSWNKIYYVRNNSPDSIFYFDLLAALPTHLKLKINTTKLHPCKPSTSSVVERTLPLLSATTPEKCPQVSLWSTKTRSLIDCRSWTVAIRMKFLRACAWKFGLVWERQHKVLVKYSTGRRNVNAQQSEAHNLQYAQRRRKAAIINDGRSVIIS